MTRCWSPQVIRNIRPLGCSTEIGEGDAEIHYAPKKTLKQRKDTVDGGMEDFRSLVGVAEVIKAPYSTTGS
jgi:hypothetical protein